MTGSGMTTWSTRERFQHWALPGMTSTLGSSSSSLVCCLYYNYIYRRGHGNKYALEIYFMTPCLSCGYCLYLQIGKNTSTSWTWRKWRRFESDSPWAEIKPGWMRFISGRNLTSDWSSMLELESSRLVLYFLIKSLFFSALEKRDGSVDAKCDCFPLCLAVQAWPLSEETHHVESLRYLGDLQGSAWRKLILRQKIKNLKPDGHSWVEILILEADS